jgi:opacity protein-like surface antigen
LRRALAANRSLRLIIHDGDAPDSPRKNEGAVMRRLLAAVGLMAAISNASADELLLPTLRGSNDLVPGNPIYLRWSGFYVGGQTGLGIASADFAHATESLIAFSLRELALENQAKPSTWQVLGKADTRGASAGVFAGYNVRYDDVVLGIDVHYNRGSFTATAPEFPIARSTSAGGNDYVVQLNGNASLHITEFGGLRVRAGYAVGNLLPYLTGGLAVGRADISRSATASGTETVPTDPPTVTPYSFTQSESRIGAFIYGWSVGGGIDVMLLPNVFLRGELEYVGFVQTAETNFGLKLGRLGAGFKF